MGDVVLAKDVPNPSGIPPEIGAAVVVELARRDAPQVDGGR